MKPAKPRPYSLSQPGKQVNASPFVSAKLAGVSAVLAFRAASYRPHVQCARGQSFGLASCREKKQYDSHDQQRGIELLGRARVEVEAAMNVREKPPLGARAIGARADE